MGSCLSGRIKAVNPSYSASTLVRSSGANSKISSKHGNVLSGNISQASSSTVPPTPRSEGEILQSTNVKSFTFNELRNATRNFRPDSVLGEGGFGSVFKGWVDEQTLTATKPGIGMVIAVKRLNHDGFQGHKEWLNYCAKLSDFGLAKDGPIGDKTHVSTRVMGTYGYAAPEYLATGHLTAKSDVYSFGVVLLEILSGRRAVDKNRPSGEHYLVEWAKPYLTNKRKIFRVLDTRLDGKYPLEEAQRAASLAFQCLATDGRLRPSMDEVFSVLDQLQETTKEADKERTEPMMQSHSFGSGSVRPKMESLEEGDNTKVSYPRPLSSPLFE
ncbi:hypothetical protein HPP92_019832 [Vanilla planifolia]|uniref:Protein kinase domain-containing protein n=1 Tax=Vanilla planifolia TaxID=51239 RepID=A0A835UJJ0_VANPL|nr:hypothetical protein HPP92_019832 [Vanilla planifolia]